jgi:hypothetical protein
MHRIADRKRLNASGIGCLIEDEILPDRYPEEGSLDEDAGRERATPARRRSVA